MYVSFYYRGHKFYIYHTDSGNSVDSMKIVLDDTDTMLRGDDPVTQLVNLDHRIDELEQKAIDKKRNQKTKWLIFVGLVILLLIVVQIARPYLPLFAH